MVSPFERILENPEYEKNFYVDGQELLCKFCQNVVLDHTNKDTLDEHLKDDKHEKNVENKASQATYYNSNDNELNELINIDLVKAFIQADIPLEKVDKLRNFFFEYCINGGAIADSSLLRDKYLPIVFNMNITNMQEIHDKRISIIIDEATDICGRAMINVLFSFCDQTKLANREYINVVNNISIAQLVMRTLQSYNIPFDNLMFFISDNTDYMLKAFQILSPLMPRLKHNHCLSHILSLVGETWVYYKNFKILANIVENIKISFVQCPARKRRWADFLNSLAFYTTISSDQNYDYSIILPPLPVKTCLSSWFGFVFWINQYTSQLRTFYIGEEMVNGESEAIRELAVIFKSPVYFFIFEILAMFMKLNAKSIVDNLEFFKIKSKPVAPFVVQRLERLESALQFGSLQPPFSDEMNNKFLEKNVDPKAYIKMFQEAYQLALNKLKKLIDCHSAMPLFNAIQCFDPRFIRAHCNNISLYSEIEEFKKPTYQIIQEWEIYCDLKEDFGNDEIDLNIYWTDKIEIIPNLSKLALEYIWLPVSGMDVDYICYS